VENKRERKKGAWSAEYHQNISITNDTYEIPGSLRTPPNQQEQTKNKKQTNKQEKTQKNEENASSRRTPQKKKENSHARGRKTKKNKTKQKMARKIDIRAMYERYGDWTILKVVR
jgi:hypothetical protein